MGERGGSCWLLLRRCCYGDTDRGCWLSGGDLANVGLIDAFSE